MRSRIAEVDALRDELAVYYCEDETTFQLDDAFKIWDSFCDKFRRSVKVRVYIILVTVMKLRLWTGAGHNSDFFIIIEIVFVFIVHNIKQKTNIESKTRDTEK